MAPELNDHDKEITEKIDAYSLGVILYFIVTKGEKLKYTGTDNYKNAKFPSSINKLSTIIINSCLLNNPNKRPSFKAIWRKLLNIILC